MTPNLHASPNLPEGLAICADGMVRPAWAATDPLLRDYYDTEWGVPVRDEQGVYERIVLEGFQAGLSWATILRKRPAFRRAFDDFVPDLVASYTQTDVARLMADAGIVRNLAKISAAITNAQATIRLREKGGLSVLVWSFRPEFTPEPVTGDQSATTSPESLHLAKALRQEGFRFVGPTTAYALMQAIGIVPTRPPGSHCCGSSGD